MLIFEGPDGAGKTSLIQKFTISSNIPVAERVVSKDAEAMVDLPKWIDRNLDAGFQYRIFDRHRLISEPIYGPILRDHQDPAFKDLIRVWRWMDEFYTMRPIIIYCLPPFPVVKANIIHDFDNQVVNSHIEAIYTAYVAKAAVDLRNDPENTYLWDYANSPALTDGRPRWATEVVQKLRSRVHG